MAASPWELQPVSMLDPGMVVLAEVNPGQPFRLATVVASNGCALLVRDENDQMWGLSFAASTEVWVKA